MTKEKLQAIFNNINNGNSINSYVFDTWLQARDIAHIIISSNSLVYPDERQQLYFDEEDEIMYIREGYYETGYDTPFVQYYLKYAIPFSSIIGIHMVTSARKKSPFKYGMLI